MHIFHGVKGGKGRSARGKNGRFKKKKGKKGRGGKKESANTARMQSLTTAVELTSRCNFHWLGGDARPWKTLKLRGQPRRMRRREQTTTAHLLDICTLLRLRPNSVPKSRLTAEEIPRVDIEDQKPEEGKRIERS